MSTTKLVMEFTDAEGINRTFNYNYIEPTAATTTRVKNLMNAMITNGSIFTHVPMAKVAAKLVTTTDESINITE